MCRFWICFSLRRPNDMLLQEIWLLVTNFTGRVRLKIIHIWGFIWRNEFVMHTSSTLQSCRVLPCHMTHESWLLQHTTQDFMTKVQNAGAFWAGWSIIPSFIGWGSFENNNNNNNNNNKSRVATNTRHHHSSNRYLPRPRRGIWLRSVATWFNSWNEAVKRCRGVVGSVAW